MLNSLATLAWLSFRRLLWSMNSLMTLGVMSLCVAGVLVARVTRLLPLVNEGREAAAFELFSERFVIGIFTTLVVPLVALAFATTSIGGDREDRTLLFLLVRPIPRWLILLAKTVATLPLALGITVGGYFLLCRIAGPAGERAWPLFLPAILLMTLAYVGLFHLLAVLFRHATIIALVYALFVEAFLGHMPGIVKRVAVSFYGRSMMFEVGQSAGLESPPSAWFVPIASASASLALLAIAAGGVLLALLIFQRKEYRDLT
ncbi:MAG: ABC transporter permease subunit [Pirellulales bacterium]